jgi:hypothetical protein
MDLDPLDQMILSRLTTIGANLTLRDLCDTDEFQMTQDEMLTRLEMLADRGLVRCKRRFTVTVEGSAALPPRVHCHRELAA